MSDYTQINDYSTKDNLSTGDPEKAILGADIDDELSAIAAAIATKYDSADLATQAQAQTGVNNSTLMTPLRTEQWGNNWADENAGMVADIHALSDPGADRLLGWDDSAGAAIAFSLVSGELEFSDTTLGVGSNVPLLDQANTFTGSPLQIEDATQPALRLRDSNATSSEQMWGFELINGRLFIRTRDSNGTLGETFLDVRRVGNTVGAAAFSADSITLNGVDVSDYARLSQENTFTSEELTIQNAGTPRLKIEDTNAGTDQTKWLLRSLSGSLSLRAISDDENSGQSALTISRSGATIDSVNVGSGELQYGGIEVGFRGVPVNEQNGNYTTVASDRGKLIFKASGGSGETITIDQSEYSNGDVITVVNDGGGNLTVTVDGGSSVVHAGVGDTGASFTLADHGIATLIKLDHQYFMASGTGLS